MTDQQRLLFQTQLNGGRKNPTTGVLLAVFLGELGAHHFIWATPESACSICSSAGPSSQRSSPYSRRLAWQVECETTTYLSPRN